VEQCRDQENPKSSPETLFTHFSIPAFDEAHWPKTEVGSAIKSQKFRVSPGVILLSKLNPEIERVWLVDVQPGDRAICSTEFVVLRTRPPFGRSFAYCLSRSRGFRQQLEGLVTGTSKSHQRAQPGTLLSLPVILPPALVAEAFERVAAPLLDRAQVCRREIRTVADLRDALLPRLISGELPVNAVERAMEAVA
jgi:type I restriction enzyme S subunit